MFPGFRRAGLVGGVQIGRDSEENIMAEVKRMTQTQLVKELAGALGVNNKVAKQFVESYAAVAVRETKKNGVFVIPGIGRLVRWSARLASGGIRPPGKRSRSPRRKL